MPDRTFFISREDLHRAFDGNVRAVRSFEVMQEVVAATAEASTAGVDATDALSAATFVTLSPNAELPNERVLKLGPGLRFGLTYNAVTVYSDAPRVTGGHVPTFIVTGPSNLALPLAGTLATREWVNDALFDSPPNVVGSRGGNAALASLLAALATIGLITDGTTP